VHVRQFLTSPSTVLLTQFGPRHFPSTGLDFGGDGRRVGDTVVVASDAGVDIGVTGRVTSAGGAKDCKSTDCGVGRTGEPTGDEKISGVPARSPWNPKPEVPPVRRPCTNIIM
jgi:hypothetical protein